MGRTQGRRSAPLTTGRGKAEALKKSACTLGGRRRSGRRDRMQAGNRGSCEDNGVGRKAWKKSGRMGAGKESEQSQAEGTGLCTAAHGSPSQGRRFQLPHLETQPSGLISLELWCVIYLWTVGGWGGRRAKTLPLETKSFRNCTSKQLGVLAPLRFKVMGKE